MHRLVLIAALVLAGCSSDRDESLVGESGFSDPSLCPQWKDLLAGCQSGLRCRYFGGSAYDSPRPMSTCWTSSATATCRNGAWVIEDRVTDCYPSRPPYDAGPLPDTNTSDDTADDTSLDADSATDTAEDAG